MLDVRYLLADICRKIKGRKKELIFFDTNCYRIIARKFGHNVPKVINKIRINEALYGFIPHLNYVVAGELFRHLADEIDNANYIECKYGLLASMCHINNNEDRFLHHPDNEIYYFFMEQVLPGELHRERSFFKSLQSLYDSNYSDAAILQSKPEYLKMQAYLNYLKDLWSNATVDTITKHFDPSFAGGWRILPNDDAGRNALLKAFIKGENNKEIFKMFAVGIVGYLLNNYEVKIDGQLNEHELEVIADRFKPVFSQQLRILKHMCTSGYNLEKKSNDIIDYLILISLHQNITLVSNETRNLNRNLKASGVDNVLSWNEYMKLIHLEKFAV